MSKRLFFSERQFAEAYDEFADAIFRHCYLRTLDRELSKELMMEAFKRLWLFASDGNRVDVPKMFLYRAADALVAQHERDMKDVLQPESADPVLSVMRMVPRAERRTLVMHFVDGFSADDISDLIGGTAEEHANALDKQRALVNSLLDTVNA